MASKKRARRSEPLFGSENDETGSLKKRTDVVEPSHTWVDEVWGNVSSRASSRVRSNLRNLVTADVAAREAVRCGALEVDFSGGVSSATKLYHQYPLRLLCPRRVVDLTKYPTCDSCVWAYAVQFGGGLVSGDRVGCAVDVADGNTCAIATQGTNKVYKHLGNGGPGGGVSKGDDDDDDGSDSDDDDDSSDDDSDSDDDACDADALDPKALTLTNPVPKKNLSRSRDKDLAHSALPTKTNRTTVQALCGRVGDGGLLAVLPDPTQAFRDARFRNANRFLLHKSASLCVVDWCVSGRAEFKGGGAGGFVSGRGGGVAPKDDESLTQGLAKGERWRFGRYETNTEIFCEVVGDEDGRAEDGRANQSSSNVTSHDTSTRYAELCAERLDRKSVV